jgi:hypothetical protein
MADIKVARLVTGEIVIFEELGSDEQNIIMQNPHLLINSHAGPGLAPLMPWAAKGRNFVIHMPSDKIMFFFPDDHCEPIVTSYIQATSTIDLSALGNVSQFVKSN